MISSINQCMYQCLIMNFKFLSLAKFKLHKIKKAHHIPKNANLYFLSERKHINVNYRVYEECSFICLPLPHHKTSYSSLLIFFIVIDR